MSAGALHPQSAGKFVSALCKAAKQQGDQARAQIEAELFSAHGFCGESSAGERNAFLEELRNICEGNPRKRYTVAKAFYRARRFPEAGRLLAGPLDLCSAKQLHLRALIAVRLDEIESAKEIWSRAIALDPDFVPAISGMLSLYGTLKDEEMVAQMRRKLETARESAAPDIFDLSALTVFEPWKQLRRMGSKNAGGYLVMDQESGYDCFLSSGFRSHLAFEQHFCAAYDVDCQYFDPTSQSLLPGDGRIRFHKKCVGGVDSEVTTSLLEYLGSFRNVFVKLSLDGPGYNWIESLHDKHLRNIRQLVIEWHNPTTKRRLACIAKLARGHALVHVHPNNTRQNFLTIAGVDIPNTFETTFVRKESSRALVPNRFPLPHPLDAPNSARNPELKLAWWPFAAQYRAKPRVRRLVAAYLSNSCGLGDFLLSRCLWWASFCAQNGIEFRLNFSNHPHLSRFLRGDSVEVFDRKSTVGESAVERSMAEAEVVYARFSGKGIPRAILQNPLSSEALLAHFAPTVSLVEAVKSAMGEMALVPGSFVSVHVRCGDAYMANPRVASDKRWSDEWWATLSEIARGYRNETVLIHCDSSEFKNAIVERFGWRSCIKAAPHHFGITQYEAVTSDDVLATLVELYVMSLSKEIRPLSRSNFSALGEQLKSHRHYFLN